jgi:hypothetical protein
MPSDATPSDPVTADDALDPPREAEVFRNTLVDLLDTPAHMLTALRFVEDTARQTTGERVMGELFQNARDAMVGRKSTLERPKTAQDILAQRYAVVGRLLVLLEPDALTVANDGARLNCAGYESLTGLNRSEKSHRVAGGGFRKLVQDTIRPMGGQGIGFKCVLCASNRPQILANTPRGERFAIELGAPRVKDLCTALARADEAALRALLTPAELAVLEQELTPDRPLAARSLPVHLGSRDVSLEALLDRLPTTTLPLWLHDPPARAAGLLGWTDDVPEDGPYDTVIRLPFKPNQAARTLDLLREELMPARQAFLGVRAKIIIQDEAKAATTDAKDTTDS